MKINLPEWVLNCAGLRIDEEHFAAMTLEQQTWYLDTVKELWSPFAFFDY
jgi:hypothetical protein